MTEDDEAILRRRADYLQTREKITHERLLRIRADQRGVLGALLRLGVYSGPSRISAGNIVHFRRRPKR